MPATDLDGELSALTSRIIGCAITVHRALGPGLLESIYRAAMAIELSDQDIAFQEEVSVGTVYKGRMIGRYRIDLVIEDRVLVEIKAVDRLNPLFEAQVLTYLRIANKRVGLLINFNSPLLKEGIRRFVL
jgi:GxxExxY protein